MPFDFVLRDNGTKRKEGEREKKRMMIMTRKEGMMTFLPHLFFLSFFPSSILNIFRWNNIGKIFLFLRTQELGRTFIRGKVLQLMVITGREKHTLAGEKALILRSSSKPFEKRSNSMSQLVGRDRFQVPYTLMEVRERECKKENWIDF